MASQPYILDDLQTPYRGSAETLGSGSLQSDAYLTGGGGWRTFNLVQPSRSEPSQSRLTFKALYAQWMDDVLFDSLPEAMKAHRSYQRIVALGERAVPLIAAELRRSPSFLFLALEDILDVDPVPAESNGDLIATIMAWLEWLQR